MLRKLRSYYRSAYTLGHFPSIVSLLFTNKKIFAYYGYLGDGNFGDELVFESAKHLFKPHILLPKRKRMPLSIFLFNKFFKNRIAGIVMGGGTLIRAGVMYPEFYGYIINKGRPIYMHGTGVDVNTGSVENWKKVFTNGFSGGVRGPLSINNFKKISTNTNVIGDAAFGMYASKTKGIETGKNVLINIGTHNSYQNMENCRIAFDQFATFLLEENFNVQFLPFHDIDYQLGKELQRKYSKITVLDIPKTHLQAINHFKGCAFAFGERLHFIVMALLSQTSFQCVNYDKKHEDLLESVALQQAGLLPAEVDFHKIKLAFENRNSFDWTAIDERLTNFKKIQVSESEKFMKQVEKA